MTSFPFVGQSYTTRAIDFDLQRSVNIYPVVSETQTSKAVSGLQGTAGLLQFSNPASGEVRGGWNAEGRCFVVVGNTLYEQFSDGTTTSRGTLLTSTGFISMSDNGSQLCVVDNPNGYVLTLGTNAFQQITDPDWPGAVTVTYLDGYFIFVEPDSGTFFISAINDGTDIDALDFATAEGSPDNLLCAVALHEQLWLVGEESTEIWADTGAADFPFERIQGAFIEYGCVSSGSVSTTANTIFWLGQDAQGAGTVWMATGYQPQRVSTFAIEYLLQQYDLTDCTSYTYQEDGHYFYILNIPSANTTLAYDIGVQSWHEKCYFNLSTGQYERHRGQCHVYAFGKHLIGDYANGIIYDQSLNYYDDNGNPKRWMRICPHINDTDDLDYIYYSRLQIDMQTGVGLITGATADITPQIMLQWSDDGGHKWSNEHWRSAGAIGEYSTRCIWRRIGRSRDRVFKAAGSSATQVFIIAAHIQVVKGTN